MDNLMNAIQQEAANTAGYLEQKLLAKEKNEQCTCTTFPHRYSGACLSLRYRGFARLYSLLQ